MRYSSYGFSYNKVRVEFGIPVVGEKWVKDVSYDLQEVNYVNPNPVSDGHFKKRILVTELGSIKSEADLFIVKAQHITIDVVYTYNESNPWSISYFNTNSNYKTSLLRSQLKDTLKKYNIR
ncbi:hypothetical protein [Mucilaginibacter gotjawali]|uniref:Uncharacterized protein n=2 Tax=Mucilaginibacter gotjawali TaxID=1550579 RepID=A0A839SH70_9SPHI|nr:hypothetical protein [Mucilaginibacter gotjawali]MBB3057186.1 hypothetical protein [Mucilaginibacter gotjawali]BAU53047.1 hypothetical protein MgSA37_01214 [Mucilaginibacter gotjawali]